jgi:hypothetical protein
MVIVVKKVVMVVVVEMVAQSECKLLQSIQRLFDRYSLIWVFGEIKNTLNITV